MTINSGGWDRREFLHVMGGLVGGGAVLSGRVQAGERQDRANPRATAGDPVEPNWKERLTVTVGPEKADLVGTDHKVLQAAVDYVALLGGGTVHILPGTYRLRNAVYLQSRVRLLGSGEDSVLRKEPSVSGKLDADSDWFDQEITLADGRGFRLGDGVCLRCKNPHNGSATVVKRTLVARSGNRFKLDRALRENFWQMGNATAATLFPLLSGENIADVVIEALTLDGNKANNENLDGNYAGCIFLQDCNRITVCKVTARHYNGDGISWQICHDVRVENCRSHDHAGLGLHPGSGSQRPVIRGNKLEKNDIGLFFCWGVKHGLADRDNDVRRSGKVGVLFRPERGKAFAPHRNRLEKNRVIDSGPDDGIGIDIQGETEAITLLKNELRESRRAASRVGIRIGAQAWDVRLTDNRTEGFAVPRRGFAETVKDERREASVSTNHR
jgi:hypothetical protein